MQTMQNTSPTSAAAVTALLSMRQGALRDPEPKECYIPSPALDLCIRRRDRTPPSSPEGARYLDHIIDSTPTTTSRFSNSSASHHDSDSSMSSDPNSSSTFASVSSYSTPLNPRLKATRPFKAYPKDPMVLALGVSSSEAFLGGESTAKAYTEFRSMMLSQVKGSHGVTNKNMRRSSTPAHAPEDPSKNEAYWEKRKKNNEAAKRSRDARRAKEDEIAIRAAFLEHENLKLKYEVTELRKETEKLRSLLYRRP